ncbi:MAG: class III extradiol ring-cleavage dioxygenase [Alphaproteobacteria bacterium]
MSNSLPTYFISHGGGPWPWLPDWRARFANLEESLKRMVAEFPERPKALLFISGHWEEEAFAVMGSPNPPMVYDYYGFPEETYRVSYPAPGAPALAQRTMELLRGAGLPARVDETQGFDHGTFAPLAIMFPDADIPVFQVSLRHGYDPAEHFAAGRALAPLRDEGVIIVGSGLSFHNLRMLGPQARAPSEAFDGWLADVMALDPAARRAALEGWEGAPHARTCHPQEDHLVPLFVALGAAEDGAATRIYHDVGLFGGVTASSYRFG